MWKITKIYIHLCPLFGPTSHILYNNFAYKHRGELGKHIHFHSWFFYFTVLVWRVITYIWEKGSRSGLVQFSFVFHYSDLTGNLFCANPFQASILYVGGGPWGYDNIGSRLRANVLENMQVQSSPWGTRVATPKSNNISACMGREARATRPRNRAPRARTVVLMTSPSAASPS